MTRIGSTIALAAALVLAACGNPGDREDGEAVNATDAPAALDGTAAGAPGGTRRENPVIEALSLNDWFRAVLVDRASIANPRDLETIGRAYCEGLTVCRTAIWFDATVLPRQMPVSAAAVEQQAYAFGRTTDGTENSLWNCDLYTAFEPERLCLPRVIR